MSQEISFFQRLSVAALWLLAALVFFRYLLVPLLPFLLALAFCALTEPLVQRFRRRAGVRRGFSATAITTGILLIAVSLLTFLVMRLAAELQGWTGEFALLLERFPALWNDMLDRMSHWYRAAPPFLRSTLDSWAYQLTREGPSLAASLGGKLMDEATSLLGMLPQLGLFLVTTLLAVYFTSLSYPTILSFLKRQLPTPWQGRCRAAAGCFRSTVAKWLLSELMLIAFTFVILFLGFSLMGLDFALLAAAAISLVDALPILGTGAVLIPWAIGDILLGAGSHAVALMLLYAAVTLSHSLLEPHLLAGQVGLPPITTLLAMYLGYHFIGVGGMICLPIFLLLLKQLSDAGVIRLWK